MRWKNTAQNARRGEFLTDAHKSRSRQFFAAHLRAAFPGPSERDVARLAAPRLGVSERQVINWLRCEHDAGVSYVTAVLILSGAVRMLGGPPEGVQ